MYRAHFLCQLAFAEHSMDFKKSIYIIRLTFIMLTVFICSGYLTDIHAQDKNKLEKANDLYKAKRYAEAIPIYEEILDQDLNKSALLKLGRSNRQINNIEAALENYKILTQQPEVKSEYQLEYVELLIINGDYLQARKALQNITTSQTTVNKIFRLRSMINNNFDLKPLFEKVALKPFIFNTPLTDENSPFLLEDKMIYTSDQTQNAKIKNKSGLTGRAYYKVWESGIEDGVFNSPELLSSKVNATNKNTANAFLAVDRQYIYYTKNDNIKDRKGFYNMQLYKSEIKNGKYGKAEKLALNSSEYNFMHPCISKDGNTLLYVSDRPGEGGTDIFISRRVKNGWSRGENLGININTMANEGYPYLDKDGNLYFCSKGHSGLGGYDIFIAKKMKGTTWDKPINLGRPFNSQHDDISIFMKECGKEGAFTSSRNGSDDIFLFHIESN